MQIPATIVQSGQAVPTDGWTDDTATAWTFASATTFTVAGDQTAKFSKGTRLKLTQTTVKYFVVASSVFGATTTVTITGGTDYTFANAAVSANYYSYQANPQGFPGWFTYAPTYGGFSVDPTQLTRFNVIGTLCTIAYNTTAGGTSNATTFTISLPIAVGSSAPSNASMVSGAATNNSVGISGVRLDLAGTTITLYRDGAGSVWTAAGAKWANFTVAYEI